MKAILCFDIGGTFIKYGVLDLKGNILYKNKIPSPRKDLKKEIPWKIFKVTSGICHEFNILGIGISTAGKVDSVKGDIIFASENLPNYTGTRLSKEVKRLTGFECFVENDVNSAAIGEYWRGAGKDIKDFVCINLGTSIGAGIFVNGRLHKGISQGAGEIGHMIVQENGEKCGCGNKGCFERYASTSALIRRYANETKLSIEDIDGEYILEKVRNKETLAVKIYNEFLNYLATGIINITHILDPGLIIIGGGISESGEEFFKDLNNIFKKRLMPSYSKYTKIVQAKLGNDAGLVGMCYIVVKELLK